MTEKQKIAANELKYHMYCKVEGKCYFCPKILKREEAHLAHRIPKGKLNRRIYGDAVIFHEKNMEITCADDNSKLNLNPATHPVEVDKLVDEINVALDAEKDLK